MPVILIRNTISDYLPLPTSTNLSHFDIHDNGLSTGAKIAIGVCVPIGVIILSAIAFILWHRRRRRNKKKNVMTNGDSQSPGSGVNGDGFIVKPELDWNGTLSAQDKQELDTGQDGVELNGIGSTPSPAELPGSSPVELPVERSPTVPQVELEGDGQASSTLSTTVREEEHREQVNERVSHDDSDSDTALREMS
ncbi:transmembrane alpha-helix domain-containing protein [Penicillium malachiteum]|uniref:Transmembrane alpha-helix domain-containing protein n=1 Tax=Penicillium malachiteum TaxID=1324776 RepID=A0AAD6MT93_9EURO|nr:transmembrane alpha-helix domain-containing protein [Penicillium malachiteum]